MGRINPAATIMECNRPGSSGPAVASAGVCDAFGVLACRQGQAGGAAGDGRPAPSAPKPVAASESGDLDLHALGHALMRKRSWIIVPTVLALVASLAAVNMVTPRLQVGSAHPGRWARERIPAAERRAQRGAHRARCRSRHQPGAAAAVARSGPRDHQEEQACRAPRIRSGAAGIFAAEVIAGPGRHRARPVLADAGRARAGSLLRALHGLRGRQIPRHRRRIPVARSRTRRARRQLDRGRLSGAAAGCAPAAGEVCGSVAVG